MAPQIFQPRTHTHPHTHAHTTTTATTTTNSTSTSSSLWPAPLLAAGSQVAACRPARPQDLKNLRQEIEILRTLRHESIIQMLDAFETKTDFCVVMEFAQGELFEILEDDQSLPEDVVQAIAKQLVRPAAGSTGDSWGE